MYCGAVNSGRATGNASLLKAPTKRFLMDQGGVEPRRSGGDGESLDIPGTQLSLTVRYLQDAAAAAIRRTRLRLFQGSVMLCTLYLLLWMATFLYGSFYYSFMPKAAYSTPVHYYYRTDCEPAAPLHCSYPTANVSLLSNGRHQVMTTGQAYRISLDLEMPDSPANQRLGMFMVRMVCYSRGGREVGSSTLSARQLYSASSSRFGILRYSSGLLRTVATLLFLPVFLTGMAEQSQRLEMELFSDYTDDPYAPSVGAVVEILSSEVQIYSSQLSIYAHFTGLRYILFHFPLMSALVGVSSNFIFLSVLLFFGYVRLLLGSALSSSQQMERSERK